MASTITFSGFNQIDFNTILNAVMTQERRPLQALEARQSSLKSQATAYTTLAGKLAALASAAEKLSSAEGLSARSVTSSHESLVAAAASGEAAPGTYEVVVTSLARAQVTASASQAPDRDSTIVATGGSLTIGGVQVSLAGEVTLQGLANAINETANVGVTASIVATAPGAYRMVLTGKETGAGAAFTVVNALAGGASPVAFGDADGDGVSGNSAADNAIGASDAVLSVNRIAMTSASNTIDEAIPGVSLRLKGEAPGTTITIGVDGDSQRTREGIDAFVTAFNDFVTFYDDQQTASRNGDAKAIGRDVLLKGLRRELQQAMATEHPNGGQFRYLSEIGLGFERSGKLRLDASRFQRAMEEDGDGVAALFGASSREGAFDALAGLLQSYTRAGGLLQGAQSRISAQLDSLARRIDDFERRLEIRRASLQRQYMAADSVMSQLNSQGGSLGSLGNQYRLF